MQSRGKAKQSTSALGNHVQILFDHNSSFIYNVDTFIYNVGQKIKNEKVRPHF